MRYLGGGGIHSPNFLHCLREQNLVVYKYVTNWIQNHDKIDDITTGPL